MWNPNDIIDDTYMIMNELGRGGTGVIYLAYHLRLASYGARHVAISYHMLRVVGAVIRGEDKTIACLVVGVEAGRTIGQAIAVCSGQGKHVMVCNKVYYLLVGSHAT